MNLRNHRTYPTNKKPEYEGLGYTTNERNDVNCSSRFIQSKKYMQCSNFNRKGHMKDKCWDLHPYNICGLKSHSEKIYWNRKCKNIYIDKCFRMDFGWSNGSS